MKFELRAPLVPIQSHNLSITRTGMNKTDKNRQTKIVCDRVQQIPLQVERRVDVFGIATLLIRIAKLIRRPR